MKRSRYRIISVSCLAILATGGLATGSAFLVPWLQSVKLYDTTEASAGSIVASDESVVYIKHSSADLLGYNWTQGLGAMASVAAKANENVITIESAYSKTLHDEKLYPASFDSQDGLIVEKHYGTQKGNQFLTLDTAGQVRNCTHHSNADLLAESRISPDLPLRADGTPMVLIYHSHTTESFVEGERGYYDSEFNYRTTDPDKNVVMVGDAIAAELTAAGIGVIHAETIHDYPTWSGSYSRSAETVSAILEEYPSICIALDIHRDAITTDGKIIAPVAEINGKKSAQIMIISGCDDGTMDMPNYLQNYHLASCLQQQMESSYPGLTRPVLFDYRKYNQNLTTGSLLIEVGGHGNTMEEAQYAGTLLGKSLVQTILAFIEEGNGN